MKDEILEYIRKHVKEWPLDAHFVFVDPDGEIRFYPDCNDDFHPVGTTPFKGQGYPLTLTREEWEQPETDLTTLDKPFGELDRATQLRLVEHVLDGGGIDRLVPDDLMESDDLMEPWVYQRGQIERKLLCFVHHRKYRATNSLEREIEQKRKELDELIARSKNT
jgi:hypothetical protein